MCPLRVCWASHALVTEEPEGKSSATVQPLMVLVVPLVIVYLPSKPVPQSEVLVKVAVAGAAKAGVAATMTVAAAVARAAAINQIRSLIADLPRTRTRWGM